MHLPRSFICSAFLGVLAGAAVAEESDAQEERLLATIPQGVKVTSLKFSPRAISVAYFSRAGQKFSVTLGDQRGAEFDGVGPLSGPVFSPDEVTVAYCANQGGSPDGMGMATGGKWFTVVGDKRGPQFFKVDFPVFSPDGKTLAYAAWKGETGGCVMNGDARGEDFYMVGRPVFSPDGKRLAYTARTNAYMSGGKELVVVNGKRGEEFSVAAGMPVFSLDGASMAYGAMGDASQHFLVVDGVKRKEPFPVNKVAFSPDGKVIAFESGSQDLEMTGFIVVGDRKYEEFDGGAFEPSFSADGKTVAYFAARKGRYLVVVGDKKFDKFSAETAPIFSPDGTTFVYVAASRKGKFLVVGETKGEEYDDVQAPRFTSDGKLVVFGARKGRELWRKVMRVK